jgi:BirA family biotin operon repressor/biotin-[acetyl-CoA-carboxylase] ligase
MSRGLSPANAIDPFRIEQETFVAQAEVHQELGSTNDRALRLAAESRSIPRLIAALRQTAGRGRGANRWWGGEGALLFSLILDVPPVAPDQVPQLSLCFGAAVCHAVCEFLPGADVRLKWPNDVFLNGRKVCGILIETPPRCSDRLVVGIGLNVNNSTDSAPQELRSRATSLRDWAAVEFSLTDVLVHVLKRIENALDEFRHNDRTAAAQRWRTLCLLTGRCITVRCGAQATTGTCLGIEDDGALLLQTLAGPQRYYGGTVETYE